MQAFVFGFGYVGEAFARRLASQGWTVAATARTPEQRAALRALGMTAVDPQDEAAMASTLAETQAILVTAPPTVHGCPGLAAIAPALARAHAYPDWIGYLSTTGVYGDREGGWVDEASPRNAHSPEGARRASAERDWFQIGRGMGLTVTAFRLPGIYGPDRSALDRVRGAAARRIIKPGHVFCRIHRDDIVDGLVRSLAQPRPGGIYNIVDDEPAPGEAVIEYAATLLGAPLPPVVSDIPDRSRRFYEENRRVSNARAKAELGWRPAYPSYREGLDAILQTSSNAVISRTRS
jgi:nucleoside-diphosphate-sugar epimerase